MKHTYLLYQNATSFLNDNYELHCKWLLLLCYENMNYHNCYLILVSIDNILKYCIIDEIQPINIDSKKLKGSKDFWEGAQNFLSKD